MISPSAPQRVSEPYAYTGWGRPGGHAMCEPELYEHSSSDDDRRVVVKHSLGFILNLSAPTERVFGDQARSSSNRMTSPQDIQHSWAPSSGPRELPVAVSSSTVVSAKLTRRLDTVTTKTSTAKARHHMANNGKRLARQREVEGCSNYIINGGRCFRHGGGKRCLVDGCSASAKVAGRCWKHGGSTPCIIDGCDRRGKSRGLCWTHGGGTKCHTVGCGKVAVSNGFCWAHGGGKRCQFDGCKRPGYERTLNYCQTHFRRFESGEEVVEL